MFSLIFWHEWFGKRVYTLWDSKRNKNNQT